MGTLDFNSLRANLDSINSAFAASQIAKQNEDAYRIARAVSEQNARRDAKMVAGAEASIAQKELLEEQLKEIREQNSQLKDNYRLLNELYESAKRDAEESAKEARHNKIFGWVSFGIGTLIGIAGIVFGIIF